MDHAHVQTAGDLLIRAVDQAMQHGLTCRADEDCPACAAGFNQIRLVYKIWLASSHKDPSPDEVAALRAENTRLKQVIRDVAGDRWTA